MTQHTASWAARLAREFDSSGIHRASTAGDHASGEWLCFEARRCGAEVSQMSVDLSRTIVDEAFIECAGQRIDGLPMFDSPAAGPGGVEGRLGACGEECEIGYLELPPNSASIKGMPFEELRKRSKHAALVVATRVTGESLAPINAQYFDAPFGAPVLQVAGMHHEFLAEQARKKATARVLSDHRREHATSYNIAARVAAPAGAAPTRTHVTNPPVVLLTPRTGWWESTAERAGGIVAWLAGLATATALRDARGLRCDVHAFATCGHELGHIGLKALLTGEKTLVETALWLHLGANLGCASNPMMMLRASEQHDGERVRELLLAEGYPAELVRIDPISAVSGEGRDLVDHGGRVLSLAGSNAHFHAASDRWPANVNAANTAAIARAVGRWLTERAGLRR